VPEVAASAQASVAPTWVRAARSTCRNLVESHLSFPSGIRCGRMGGAVRSGSGTLARQTAPPPTTATSKSCVCPAVHASRRARSIAGRGSRRGSRRAPAQAALIWA
jgi:hypothetical protein